MVAIWNFSNKVNSKIISEMDSFNSKTYKKYIYLWFYYHYISNYTNFVFWMEVILNFSSMGKFLRSDEMSIQSRILREHHIVPAWLG